MRVRISKVEEHTSRLQRTVDGAREISRPVTSVTLEFKFESGGSIIRQMLKNSRGFGQLMNDGHPYQLRTQLDRYAWVSVTYRICPANANPYGASTTHQLKQRALKALRQKVNSLVRQT